jgi:hypothetical protein
MSIKTLHAASVYTCKDYLFVLKTLRRKHPFERRSPTLSIFR